MFASALLLGVLQIGPFWQKGPDDLCALRPLWSRQGETTDVLWPVFTAHRDWWRFCWFTHWQAGQDGAYQFEILPLWFNGRTRQGEDYWGLFPLWGRHPHFLEMEDWRFCLWPLWHRYRRYRPAERRWLTSNAVLWPLVTWRDDGSWGVWPLCGFNRRRESDHRYALWPLVTWADYRADRDTGGAGSSWMVWPLCGGVTREREDQWLFLPPLFSFAETRSPASARAGSSAPDFRLRCPWPIFEYESGAERTRLSVFPLYESVRDFDYATRACAGGVTRFGWRLVEIYRDAAGEVVESRVFPFWKRNARHTRVWPIWETYRWDDLEWSGALALFPITWADSVDRNWASYWTPYERLSCPVYADHSLFWGLIRWRTYKD